MSRECETISRTTKLSVGDGVLIVPENRGKCEMRFGEGVRSGKTYEAGADRATGPGAPISALCWGLCGLNASASAPSKSEGVREPLDWGTPPPQVLAHRRHRVNDLSLTFSLSPLLLWSSSTASLSVLWGIFVEINSK